jgi:transposase
MQIHGRAKLGPAGRLALTQAVIDGMTLRQAATCFSVSPATAHRWWHRRLNASAQELSSGAWLLDRSSRPHRSPRLLDAVEQQRICEAPAHRLGATTGGRKDRSPSLHGVEGLASPWPLPTPAEPQRSCTAL